MEIDILFSGSTIRYKSMKSIYKHTDNRGFTLIEVIIATFILVVALLGTISTTVIVIKSDSLGRMMTTATTLAKDKMESIKNSAATTAGYDAVAGGSDTQQTIYTRTWTVNNNSPMTNMKTVTVTVSWYWGILPRSVVLSTIIAK